MRLIDIYTLAPHRISQFLYDMLKDRPPVANISHKQMPTWEQHCAFIDSMPYRKWFVIEHDGKWIGQIYLTHANEIGLHLSPESRGQDFGKEAVQRLIKNCGPGRYLANIAPGNVGSQDFFRDLGFKLIQYTFEFEHVED